MPLIAGFRALLASILVSGLFLTSGAAWQSNGPPFPYVSDLVLSPESPLVVYAVAGDFIRGADGAWRNPSALFQSADGGTTWKALANAPAGETAYAIAVDPIDSSRLLASTTTSASSSRVYATRDGGVTWALVADIAACYRASVAFENTSGRAYAAACGDLIESDDGEHWTTRKGSLPEYATLQAGARRDLYAISPDEVLRSTDHGDSWSSIAQAPPSCPSITAFADDPEESDVFYVGVGRGTPQGRFECGGLFKSPDGGRNLSRTSLPNQYVTKIVIDPGERSRVYASSVNVGFFSPKGGVARSVDAGLTWDDFSDGLSRPVGRLAISPSGRLLYGSVNLAAGGVYRRTILKQRLLPPREP
ncbi:MAG: hypothetical protein M3167_02160 [Acidobacteriota bacterium]|nr:hypothetical protein [Acidobacteriota bacterium]